MVVVPADGVVHTIAPSALADQGSVQVRHLRLLSGILGWGGLFGPFLAPIGIYGVVACAVTQRVREMAIRLALGANRTGVVRALALDGMRLAISGLAVGLVAAIAAAGLLRSVLTGSARPIHARSSPRRVCSL